MKPCTVSIVGIGTILLLATSLPAEIRIVVERRGPESAAVPFQFKNVPSPSQNDAATKARFTLLDGRSDIKVRENAGESAAGATTSPRCDQVGDSSEATHWPGHSRLTCGATAHFRITFGLGRTAAIW